MKNSPETYYKYINSGRLARLADKISGLEDEFKVCRQTGQTERAAFIECILGELYKSLMHEVRKQGLSTIEVTENKVKVTYKRAIFDYNI